VTYIIDAIRTPIGKQNGIFKHLIPEELASKMLLEILKKNKISPSQICNIFMANAFGTGGNMSRNASLRAFPENNIACTTIDAQCSGGLRAIEIGSAFCIENDYVLAGGMESCSLAPLKYYDKLDPRFIEKPYSEAEFNPNEKNEKSLFVAAQNVAKKYNISKSEMIEWTFEMHKRADISKVFLQEFIRENTLDQLLKPKLGLDDWYKLGTTDIIDRTTTARPADAAAVLILSANQKNAIAKILYLTSLGNKPDLAPEGIIDLTRKMIEKSRINFNQIACFEISDSFAVNALAFAKEFDVPKEKINKSGGILAFGHAYGATGAINVVHLLASLKPGEKGLVAVPGAGGQATGMIIEKM
jgi:acetyl-CoA C-acetyltransferase